MGHTTGSGSQLGSGRPKLPREARREHAMAVRLRDQEARDLAAIGAAWGVAPASVAWAIVVDALAAVRGHAPDFGTSGLPAAMAAHLLKRAQAREPTGAAALEQLASGAGGT